MARQFAWLFPVILVGGCCTALASPAQEDDSNQDLESLKRTMQQLQAENRRLEAHVHRLEREHYNRTLEVGAELHTKCASLVETAIEQERRDHEEALLQLKELGVRQATGSRNHEDGVIVDIVAPVGDPVAQEMARKELDAEEEQESQGEEGTHGRRLEMRALWRTMIVDLHNEMRRNVSFWQPCHATDMRKLVWDSTLEARAREHARTCRYEHDTRNAQQGWGENLARAYFANAGSGTPSLDQARLEGFVRDWFAEGADVDWYEDNTRVRSRTYLNYRTQCSQPESDGQSCVIGHYTQLVEASSFKIGCDAHTCGSSTALSPNGAGGVWLVCKYQAAGNRFTRATDSQPSMQVAPFTTGRACAACMGSCESGNLCTVAPQTCQDGLGVTMGGINAGGTVYTDCALLLAAGATCAQLRGARPAACPLTCGDCTIPDGTGIEYCATSTSSTTSWNPEGQVAMCPCGVSGSMQARVGTAPVAFVALMMSGIIASAMGL